jgi:hypothetical protein
MAETNSKVDEFYKAAMAAGAGDNISPRSRVEYYPGYYAADVFDPDGYHRREQLIEADAMQHLRPNAIDDPERYLGSVLRRIDMQTEGSFAERRFNNLHDGFRDRANISILRHESGECLLDFLAITFYKAHLSMSLTFGCRQTFPSRPSGS